MKKTLISFLTIATLVIVLSGCSKKESIQFDNFYGETEKWVVIGTKGNVFQFMYKGNADKLKKNNDTSKINFFYGTSSGSTGSTQSLNDTSYYKVIFKDDFITELPSNSAFNGNKFVNVQISYADTTDSIDLAPFIECNGK